jgi:hypothetical protein
MLCLVCQAEARRRLEEADRQERLALERQRETERRIQDQQQVLQHEMQRREEDLRRQQVVLELERCVQAVWDAEKLFYKNY